MDLKSLVLYVTTFLAVVREYVTSTFLLSVYALVYVFVTCDMLFTCLGRWLSLVCVYLLVDYCCCLCVHPKEESQPSDNPSDTKVSGPRALVKVCEALWFLYNQGQAVLRIFRGYDLPIALLVLAVRVSFFFMRMYCMKIIKYLYASTHWSVYYLCASFFFVLFHFLFEQVLRGIGYSNVHSMYMALVVSMLFSREELSPSVASFQLYVVLFFISIPYGNHILFETKMYAFRGSEQVIWLLVVITTFFSLMKIMSFVKSSVNSNRWALQE